MTISQISTQKEMPNKATAAESRLQKIMDNLRGRARQLNVDGFSSDISTIKNRFKLLWSTRSQDDEVASGLGEVTMWRRRRSRAAFREIQSFDNHIFLASLLVITPTRAASKDMSDILAHLRKIENYRPYQFALKKDDQDAMESIAIEEGFADNKFYREMIQVICPASLAQASNGLCIPYNCGAAQLTLRSRTRD